VDASVAVGSAVDVSTLLVAVAVLPCAGVELEHPADKKKARMSVGTKRFFMIGLDSLERNNNRQNGRLEFRPNDALQHYKV